MTESPELQRQETLRRPGKSLVTIFVAIPECSRPDGNMNTSNNASSGVDGSAGQEPAHSAASATPTRRMMVFRRTIVPAPSAAGPSSAGGQAGAARSSLGQRAAIGTGARQAAASPPPPSNPILAAQHGLSWATVAARNAGNSGVTIRMQEPVTRRPEEPRRSSLLPGPAPAPTWPPRRAVAHQRQTFSSPLEEGARSRTQFHPMDAIYVRKDNTSAWDRDLRGFSPNYRGNINNPRNRAPESDPNANCSLFITNLPVGCTVAELLDALCAIGPFGKVYQTHVMAPSGGHRLCSARLAMWDRISAERVKRMIDAELLVIRDRVAVVVWDHINKVPHMQQTALSRVLHIRGPSHIVDVSNIYDILNDLMISQKQRVSVMWETEDQREIRWIFGSFYAQGEPARMALLARWADNPNIRIWCGIDPMTTGLWALDNCLRHEDPGPDNERHTVVNPLDDDDDL